MALAVMAGTEERQRCGATVGVEVMEILVTVVVVVIVATPEAPAVVAARAVE